MKYYFGFQIGEKFKVVVEDGQRSRTPPWGAVKLDQMESVEDCREVTEDIATLGSPVASESVDPANNDDVTHRFPGRTDAGAELSPASEDGEIAIAVRVKKKKKGLRWFTLD